LSEEEQENELSTSNPLSRPAAKISQVICKKSTKISYLNNIASSNGYEKAGDKEDEEGDKNSVRLYL
jgi:hypothetical protein